MKLHRTSLSGVVPLCGRRALTLLEMMVAVTLLAAIMVGLLMMFNQTQKALHVASQQADVFENVRSGLSTIARDLSEMTTYNDANVVNAYALQVPNPIAGNSLPLDSGNVPVFFDETFWLTRINDDWQGIGYFVGDTNYGVGTLYRFSGTVRQEFATNLQSEFLRPFPTNTYRISDGVVHFQLTSVYPEVVAGVTNYVSATAFEFRSNAIPAYIDVELGILESTTLKQFHSLTEDVAIAKSFLVNHAGNVHFFRERVPIRNFINPYRSNEVP